MSARIFEISTHILQAYTDDKTVVEIDGSDIEFDLQEDRDRCLHNLKGSDSLDPQDVLRVHQIFTAPSFYLDSPAAHDIVQGELGNGWFISALAAMSVKKGLMEKICVARDEEVGIYGFIFYRDSGWTDVIIDDFLCTSMPKYEELDPKDKHLYKYDKGVYNAMARKGSKTLYFAKSGTENETWVPLIEKAYAKLHGDYASLEGGFACEGIEDLTGGVATEVYLSDILDEDRFWSEELLKVNQDRLFSCSITPLANNDNVQGLYPSHSYSILSALEVKGTRFLKIRNPWGRGEWTGRWSDGSKEWSGEWLPALRELQHTFGDDGQFLMEYQDFLTTWSSVARTRLFDSSWMMSSHWLNVNIRPFPCAWSFGDISFTISVAESTPTVIVLSQLDDRHFSNIAGDYYYGLDFLIFRRGEQEPLTRSSHDKLWRRSVSTEVDLEVGEYVVHVRIDADIEPKPEEDRTNWNMRKLARTETDKLISQSVALNFDMKAVADKLPLKIESLAGRDVTELELLYGPTAETKVAVEVTKNDDEQQKTEKQETGASELTEIKLVNPDTGDAYISQANEAITETAEGVVNPIDPGPEDSTLTPVGAVHDDYTCGGCKASPIVGPRFHCLDSECADFDLCEKCMNSDRHRLDHCMFRINTPAEGEKLEDPNSDGEQNSVILGLRVYTKRHAPATIKGQLRHGALLQQSQKPVS